MPAACLDSGAEELSLAQNLDGFAELTKQVAEQWLRSVHVVEAKLWLPRSRIIP